MKYLAVWAAHTAPGDGPLQKARTQGYSTALREGQGPSGNSRPLTSHYMYKANGVRKWIKTTPSKVLECVIERREPQATEGTQTGTD